MDEQEVERQLALWRDEMRLERERRLAASAVSSATTPKRCAPECAPPDRATSAPKSRLALYKSELDETTQRVPTVKLLRYTRPHVDPRDVDFFEARSVLRDYIRQPPAAREDKHNEESKQRHDGHDATNVTSKTKWRPSQQPPAIPLNRSAVLRQQVATQIKQQYDKPHTEGVRKSPLSPDGVTHGGSRVHTDRVLNRPTSKGQSSTSAALRSTLRTDSRWNRSRSPPRLRPRDGLSATQTTVTPAYSFLGREEAPEWRSWGPTRSASPPSRFHVGVNRAEGFSTIFAMDQRAAPRDAFTSRLQLRYGQSAPSEVPLPTTRFSPRPARQLSPTHSALEHTPPRWTTRGYRDSPTPKRADLFRPMAADTARAVPTFRPPRMHVEGVKRADLFQGGAAPL